MLVRKYIVNYLLMATASVALFSCNHFGDNVGNEHDKGQIRISFAASQEIFTRAGSGIPDTSDFLLSVIKESGTVIYEGTVADSPECLVVEPGSYNISVISERFSKPAFDKPQWGDEQYVGVKKGETVNVRLVCRLTNAGVKIQTSDGFLTKYPDGVIRLQSAQGRLTYGYSERRIAYFLPGSVSVILNQNAEDKVLASRTLNAQDIITFKIDAGTSADVSGGHIDVAVDTSRNWINENIRLDGSSDGKGDLPDNAMTVNQAQDAIGSENVWVCGHIAGGDCTSTNASFTPPFSSNTHIMIASRASVTDKASCICVQLPKGSIRDALNLVDNPDNLGKKVYVRGDIVESYYGIVGLKNIDEYKF